MIGSNPPPLQADPIPVPPKPPVFESDAKLKARSAALDQALKKVSQKGNPRRFAEPVSREKKTTKDPHRFSEADLEAFIASLDAELLPSGADEGLKRVWTHFRAARFESFVTLFVRIIRETEARDGRRMDPTSDEPELTALEHSIDKTLLRADRHKLRSFIGRTGIELWELAYALWISHADGWYALATAPSALTAVATLLGGAQDGVERTRHDAFGPAQPHRVPTPAPARGPVIKAYLLLGSNAEKP
jgi:hypothetical protein